MRNLSSFPFRSLGFLVAGLVGLAVWAGDPVPDVDIILEQIPGGSMRLDSHSGGFDEIELKVGKEFAKALSPVSLPEGWSLETDGKTARLSGPDLPSGQPVRLELDAGSAPRPEKISYRVRLEGRTLLERKNEPAKVVPPQQVIGSLEGVVTMPTQVAPGEPMQMRVEDDADLPAGGTWTLSGTVVAEEESAEDEEGRARESRRRVALAVPSEHSAEVPDEALGDIAAVVAAQEPQEGGWEVVPLAAGDPALEGEAVDVWSVARRAESRKSQQQTMQTMSNVSRVDPDAAGNVLRNLEAALAGTPSEGEGGSAYLVRPARESSRARTQIVVVDGAFGITINEPDMRITVNRPDMNLHGEREVAGPALEIEPVEGSGAADDGVRHYFDVTGDRATDEGATYFASTSTSRSNLKKTVWGGTNPDGTVDFLVPDLQPGDSLALRYVDAFGEVVLDVPEVPGVEVVEPSAGGDPRITDATPRAFAGRRVCVCGVFPGPDAWNGLLLDGDAVGPPVSASTRMAWVQLPAGLAPGEHVFTGAPEPGFTAEDRAATLVLQVGGQLDSSKLQRMESTPMRLWVQGTEEPLDLRVRNLTPGIISIEGGEDQVIRTSGGAPNQLERTVQGLSPGAFNIQYELAGRPCPCGSPAGVEPEEVPPASRGETSSPPDDGE